MLRRSFHHPQQSQQQLLARTASTSSVILTITTCKRTFFTSTQTNLSIPMSSSQGKTPWENLMDWKTRMQSTFYWATGRERQGRALEKKIRGKHNLQKAASVIVVANENEKKVSSYGQKGEKFNGEKFKVLFVSRTSAQTHTTSLDFANRTTEEDYGEDYRIAHSNDKIYDFVGGKVEVGDVMACDQDSSFQEALACQVGTKMPWIPERITVLRELADELGICIDHQGNFRSRKYIQPTYVSAHKLIPFMELVSPVQDGEENRLDMSYFLLQAPSHAVDELELTPKMWGREDDVVDAKWLTVEEALNEHNKLGSGFKLAPFTHFLVHHLGQHPSTGTLFATSRLKHRNDLMEMTIGEPFVETTDGNYNMHFQREQMPTMPCGKHVLGSLGYELPYEFRDENGGNVIASRLATVGSTVSHDSMSDYSADGKPKKPRAITIHDVNFVGKNEFAVPHSEVFSKSQFGNVADIVKEDEKSTPSEEGDEKNENDNESEEKLEGEGQNKKKIASSSSSSSSSTEEEQQNDVAAATNKKTATKAKETEKSDKPFKPAFTPKTFPKLVVHVGSPLMQSTNEIHQAYYNRVIEYRKSNLVDSKWKREESRMSSKWDAVS